MNIYLFVLFLLSFYPQLALTQEYWKNCTLKRTKILHFPFDIGTCSIKLKCSELVCEPKFCFYEGFSYSINKSMNIVIEIAFFLNFCLFFNGKMIFQKQIFRSTNCNSKWCRDGAFQRTTANYRNIRHGSCHAINWCSTYWPYW